MYKKSLINSLLFLLILFISQNVQCDNRTYVNLECFEITRISTTSTIRTFFMEKVVYPNESVVINTHDIWQLKIETGMKSAKSVKFVPVGIKKKFTKLASLKIIQSGLIHLEREDMRQFGKDLI